MTNLKRFTRTILLLFILISSSTFCFSQSSDSSAAQTGVGLPQVFLSSECGFTIGLPGTQTPEHRLSKDKDGQQIDIYHYTWVTNIGTYNVTCIDTPKTLSNQIISKSVLDSMRDLFLSKNSAKPTRNAEISADGYPGREIFLEDSVGGIFIQRFYAVGQRAFDLNVYLPEANRSKQAEVIKILDSFKPASSNQELGEVERLLHDSKEKIYGTCQSDDPQCKPVPGSLSGGALNKHAISLPQPPLSSNRKSRSRIGHGRGGGCN